MPSPPIGIGLMPSIWSAHRNIVYKGFIFILTYLCYASYHLSRKPVSVVKSVLHQNCSLLTLGVGNWHNISNSTKDDTWCDWPPFDKSDYDELLGSLDYGFLFAYAVGMFISGHVAERMNLRHFLTIGMIGSGILTATFGLGYFFNIHVFAFYVIVQIVAGLFSSTGWPSVVACMGNWYGKSKRGLIMGIWNSHTSVGNILGAVIPALFVETAWGWSFVVPGIIIGSLGVIVFFFLVPAPEDVGCPSPDHLGKNVTLDVEAPHSQTTKPELQDKAGSVQILPSASEETPLITSGSKDKPVTFLRALFIPGVIEFALCLFFAKLVSYTFLFWLPFYIKNATSYKAEASALLSTLFDVGGIAGGILAGIISDVTGARAATCTLMLLAAAPMMYVYSVFGSLTFTHNVVLLLVCGLLVNGPYALITTAVSADLGTHKSLLGNAKALATVTAIIDGTGSMGAALGPLLTGLIAPLSWEYVFYMLIAADGMASLLLIRLVYRDVLMMIRRIRGLQ
ncbi:glucose-6-phosphate exchanger SLC37A2-like [Liolophura sinensis]|uniref:glucose-6-phosphate exchanger SLC37A2-like n=1 Tax=Liolophura sinensis TaxID=3198878 RepID=UPI003158FE91